MYNLMKNLIVNKFYKAMEEAIEKLKVFFAIDDINQEQLVELVELAREKYEVKVEEKPVDKVTEVKPVETANTTLDNSNKSEEVKTAITQ